MKIARITVLLVLLSIAGCHRVLMPRMSAPIGGLTLADPQGNIRPLADFRAKILLINFWASWCMTCIAEMRQLDALQSRFPAAELQVLGVMVDDTPANLLRVAQYGDLSFPLLNDYRAALKGHFAVNQLPTTLAIDCHGNRLELWDPVLQAPAAAIIGVRPWDGEEMVSTLNDMVSASDC